MVGGWAQWSQTLHLVNQSLNMIYEFGTTELAGIVCLVVVEGERPGPFLF